jgi:outer membrane cobalamin receptor
MITSLILGLIIAVTSPDNLSGQPVNNENASTLSDSLTLGMSKQAHQTDSIPVFMLKGIVVTATRTPLAQQIAPASINVIQSDHASPGKEPAEAFSQVTGASTGFYGGLGSMANFSIRGSSVEQVVFLLNGMPLNSALNGGYDLKKLSAGVTRIEIVKGPSSALYGANALAGVVNIITDDEPHEKPYSKVTYLYGKHRQQNMSAIFNRELYRFMSISLSADWKSTDGERTNSDFSGSNYLLGLKIKPDSLFRIGLEYQSYQSLGGSPGSIYWLTPNDRMSDNQQDYYAILEYADFARFKIGQSQISTFYYYGYDNTAPSNFSRQSNADLQLNHAFGKKFNTVFGGAYQLVRSESDNSGNHKTNQYSAFINQEFRPVAQWLAVAGVRYDRNYGHDDCLSPNIASSWKFSEELTAYANYGEAYRVPTLNELYWKDPYMSGNPDLVSEKSRQYELGARYTNDNFNTSASIYQRQTNDMIRWQSDPYTWLTTTVNNMDVATSGIEMTGGIVLWKYFTFDFNYSYCLAKVSSDSNRELNYTPANSANISFSASNIPITKSLLLNLQFNTQYKDRQIVSHPSEWGPGSELPHYLISSQTISLKIRDALLFYKVDNLFNAEYQVRQGYPMPRRSYAFGISMELWD